MKRSDKLAKPLMNILPPNCSPSATLCVTDRCLTKRIFVVDNNESVRDAIGFVLESHGYWWPQGCQTTAPRAFKNGSFDEIGHVLLRRMPMTQEVPIPELWASAGSAKNRVIL